MGRGGEGEMGRKRKYLSSQVMVHSTGLEENFSTWNAIAKYLLRLIKQKQSWKLVQTMNVLQSTLTQGCGTMPSLSLSPPLPLSPSPLFYSAVVSSRHFVCRRTKLSVSKTVQRFISFNNAGVDPCLSFAIASAAAA